MLISRRIYQDAPNHKLETLVRYKQLKTDGIHHRALADAEMTAHLGMRIIEDIKQNYCRSEVPFRILQQLGKTPKKKVHQFLSMAGK